MTSSFMFCFMHGFASCAYAASACVFRWLPGLGIDAVRWMYRCGADTDPCGTPASILPVVFVSELPYLI